MSFKFPVGTYLKFNNYIVQVISHNGTKRNLWYDVKILSTNVKRGHKVGSTIVWGIAYVEVNGKIDYSFKSNELFNTELEKILDET